MLAVTWFAPIDFLRLTSSDKALVLITAGVLTGVGLVAAPGGARALRLGRWAAGFVILQALALLLGYPSLGYIALAGFVAGGCIVARSCAGAFKVAVGAAVLASVITLEQWITHSYSYIRLFGPPLLAIEPYGGYRSRGTLGEPLAVAVVFSTILLAAGVASWLNKQRPWWESVAFLVLVVAIALATGSRTAVVVPTLALIFASIVLRRRQGFRSLKWLSLGAIYVVGTIGVLGIAIGWSFFAGELQKNRAFGFSQLSQSQSYTNRTNAAGVILGLVEAGSFEKLVLGHGDRALQKYLEGTNVLGGFDTGDDQYLTFAYDFGLVGVLVMLGLWIVAIRGLRMADNPIQSGAAAGLVCWLMYSGFIDNLYLFSGDVAVGLLTGWAVGAISPARVLAARRTADYA